MGMKFCGRLLALILLVTGVAVAPAAQPRSGKNTCPTSGAKQVSATSARASTFTVQGTTANTGTIYVGDSTVDTSTGVALTGNDAFTFPPQGNAAAYDLKTTYFACTVNTDTITFIYVQ